MIANNTTDQFKKIATKQLNLIPRFCLNVNYGHWVRIDVYPSSSCHTDCEVCPKMSHSYSTSCTVAFWSSPSVRFVQSTVQYMLLDINGWLVGQCITQAREVLRNVFI